MAEVFGTVASAAALAELCVKSIFKVKKLWDEVKGVSEEIERLIDDNRPLQPFLQRIEAMIDRQRHVTSEPTSQSTVQAYGNVARGLESLSASLKQQLNCARKGKRTLKKLKSTFEKDLIQSYRMRLQTLSCPLFLSLSMDNLELQTGSMGLHKQSLSLHTLSNSRLDYLVALVESQIIRSAQTTQLEPLADEHVHDMVEVANQYDRSQVKTHLAEQQLIPWRPASVIGNLTYETCPNSDAPNSLVSVARQVRLQLPAWVSARAGDLHVHKAYGGWTIRINAWTTRPETATIFRLVKQGSWPEILRHMEKGHASLFDRDEWGDRLLYHAISSRRLDVAGKLVEMGLGPGESLIFEKRHLKLLVEIGDGEDSPGLASATLPWMSIFHLILSPADHEEFFLYGFDSSEAGSPLALLLWSTPGLLSWLLKELADYRQLSTKDIFASLYWWTVNPRVFLDEILRSKIAQPHHVRAIAMSSFVFGAESEDWRLIWELDAEEFAGEFWEIVENPRQHIPGAWVDDGDEDMGGW